MGNMWKKGIKGSESLDIISSDDEEICVIAGPGTGKTFALKRKVLRHLEEGSDPSKILVVTFSRTAASDIKEELLELGFKGTDKIIASTLHSFCFSVLNREGVLDYTGRKTRILLDYEKRIMLEDLRNLGLGSISQLKKRLIAFEAGWARLQTEEPGWSRDENDRIFQKKLLDWLIFHDSMIIEEIVPETYTYLRDNPASPENNKFDYIFVDEYQDLNKAEQKLLELLAGNGSSVMVIGDEDQSIYESFRHAHPEGIKEYNENHSKGIKPLNTCRRCPQNVVSIASELINNNEIRYFSKDLKTIPEKSDGEITLVQWSSLDAEVEGIVDYIKKKVDEDSLDIGRILVLSPNREIGHMIRDRLNEMEIKAYSFFSEQELKKGNPKKNDECEHKQAFTLLTLLAHPEDKVALRCWFGFGSSNLKAPSYKILHDYCNSESEDIFNVLEQIIREEIKIKGINPIIKEYIDLKILLDELKSLKGYELVDKLFPEDKSWSNQFRSLLNDVTDDSSALDIFEVLRLNITQPEMPTDVDYVRIMSLYKSKGLTADLIIITSCVDGIIPFKVRGLNRDDSKRHLEEQRRLFYVGLTRTTNILVISTFLQLPSSLAHRIMPNLILRRRGGNVRTRTSPFISELGSEAPRVINGDRWTY